MSKSLEFCKNIATDPARSSYSDRDWRKAIEFYDTEAIFDKYLHGNRSFTLKGESDGIKISIDVDFLFDNNIDFDYFTSDSCIHDGTLLFVGELINKCARKVCNLETYYKPLGEPQDRDVLKYNIGNFVILNEYNGDFVPNDKPWLCERTTVLLPIKVEKRSLYSSHQQFKRCSANDNI